MEDGNEGETVRILCSKLILFQKNETGLQWLIGSPFYSPFTVISTFKCIHNSPLQDSISPDYQKESEDLQTLLLKGFEIIGAMIIGNFSFEQHAREAIDAARKMRNHLCQGKKVQSELMIGAVADSDFSEVQFFLSRSENSTRLDSVTSFKDENDPKRFIWETGCLLRCELPVKLPFYFPLHDPPEMEKMFIRSTEAVVTKLQDPQVVYLVEPLEKSCDEGPPPVIVQGSQLDFRSNLSNFKLLTEDALDTCGHLCTRKAAPSTFSAENSDSVKVSVLLNSSKNSATPTAPVAEFLPAMEEARLMVVSFRLEVLCYAAKALSLIDAIALLIIPALVDQLISMRNTILPNLLKKHSPIRPYHFCPPGSLHPITVIYELSYGETEIKQVEVRKSLHLRLGLPFDRPLLRIANALDLSKEDDSMTRKGSILKDVHVGIPSSGVSGGSLSLVQGSYEYYHYLQNGYNDSGWGCAYRSLQTIISWFRLQHYTSLDIPSHREIQETLVEIGDKDSSFISSREWIGAIELSFVLDKLLGVSCKVINVRTGAELPEKCRELAFHFENQGTPIMIGGGVLAYTLLGIDYNETSGDCAFLILDPHYTGGDEHKKIVNGGWCGWKKAVDSKGKNFFLHDKFYNLLLPQAQHGLVYLLFFQISYYLLVIQILLYLCL